MKKYIVPISLLCAALALFPSCEDDADNQGTPSQVYMENTGQANVSFYNTGEDMHYTTRISRSGADLTMAGSVRLEAFTAEELAAYNTENGTSYQQIPESCYSITNPQVDFEAGQPSAIVEIVLRSTLGTLPAGDYVLPLNLRSDNLSISAENQQLVLHISIVNPTLTLERSGLQELTLDAEWNATYSSSIVLSTPNQGWNFSVGIERDETTLQTLVDNYNSANGTDYTMLPAASYTLPESVEFTEGQTAGGLVVNIEGSKLESLTSYLLPVVLTGCEGMSFGFEEGRNTAYILVATPVGELPKIAISDKITCNDPFDSSNFGKITDGSGSTSWQSCWWKGPSEDKAVVSDPTYGIYLDISNLSIEQALKLKVTSGTGNNLPVEWSVYKKEADDSYTLLATYTNVFDKASQVFETEPLFTEGLCSSIRISFTKSNNTRYSGGDLTALEWVRESGFDYCSNVSIGEIELYGK